MGVHFDTSQVDRLAADLSKAPGRIQRSAPKVMKKGALQILRAARDEFSGHSHAPEVPRSLEMEQRDRLGLAWEVGELDSGSKGEQWGIAHILQYGTPQTSPVADIKVALRGEVPIIMRHLGDEAEDSVLGGAE